MQIQVDTSEFQDYPIEFKEINPEDFLYTYQLDGTRTSRNNFQVENNSQKIIIEPNQDGYINEVLQSHLSLEHKNTVVINAAVGQGKTYAIIKTIKRYYDKIQNEDQKYLIFVASPFVSLVKQYCNKIQAEGISEEEIYNYNNIGRNEISYLDKPIQVITANTLLGNPGEDGFKNSDAKRDYLNNLAAHCIASDIKTIFIYDEIHDSFKNFKQEYIFNLWKWKSTLHKNIIISATYNEASKVVIEYLAELTDFKLKLVESTRIVHPAKQSELHLYYSSAHNFTSNTPEIANTISSLLSSGKNIDILTYSKALAKSLLDTREPIGKSLSEKFDLNDCTSELLLNQRTENEEPKNQYDNSLSTCNIGTNFKTGVSIEKENHAFLIILPPRATRLWFRNKYGIFSGGINSIIQSLARQRIKGEIHIILPKPDRFEYSSLNHSSMSTTQKSMFENYYEMVCYYKEPEKKVKYIKLQSQDYFMRVFYEHKLKRNVINQIQEVETSSSRVGLPVLKYPSYEEFKLENGEDYLANDIPFFGGDISAYLTYSAITNQFINCRLKSISFRPVIIFNEGQVQSYLSTLLTVLFGEDYYYSMKSLANFQLFHSEFKKELFTDYQLKFKRLDSDNLEDIKPNTTVFKKFEVQLLHFVMNLWGGTRTNYDVDFTRSNYFLDNIAHSVNTNLENIENEAHKNRVEFYQLLNDFRIKIINSISTHGIGRRAYTYITTTPVSTFFTHADKEKLEKLISLIDSDTYLRDNVFNFKRRFKNDKTIESKLAALYSIIIEDFLGVQERAQDPRINIEGQTRRKRVKVVLSVLLIPQTVNSLNLLSPQGYNNDIIEAIIEKNKI